MIKFKQIVLFSLMVFSYVESQSLLKLFTDSFGNGLNKFESHKLEKPTVRVMKSKPIPQQPHHAQHKVRQPMQVQEGAQVNERVNVFGKHKKVHGHFGDPHQDGRGVIRVQEALRHHNGSIDVILLGDSILSHIQLNQTIWNKFHRKYKAINLGAPRDRTEHLLFRLSNEQVTQPLYNAKFCVISIGTNNIGVGDSVETVYNGIVSVVDKSRYVFNKNMTVLLLSLLPRNNNFNLTQTMVKINKRLFNKYLNSTNVYYINLFDRFIWKVSRFINRDLFMPDNLHPNWRGYEVIIDTIKPFLQGKFPPKVQNFEEINIIFPKLNRPDVVRNNATKEIKLNNEPPLSYAKTPTS